jgi:hypothetical protein
MRLTFSTRIAVLLTWGAPGLGLMTAVAPQVEAQVETAPPTKFFGTVAAAFGQTIRVNVSIWIPSLSTINPLARRLSPSGKRFA